MDLCFNVVTDRIALGFCTKYYDLRHFHLTIFLNMFHQNIFFIIQLVNLYSKKKNHFTNIKHRFLSSFTIKMF